MVPFSAQRKGARNGGGIANEMNGIRNGDCFFLPEGKYDAEKKISNSLPRDRPGPATAACPSASVLVPVSASCILHASCSMLACFMRGRGRSNVSECNARSDNPRLEREEQLSYFLGPDARGTREEGMNGSSIAHDWVSKRRELTRRRECTARTKSKGIKHRVGPAIDRHRWVNSGLGVSGADRRRGGKSVPLPSLFTALDSCLHRHSYCSSPRHLLIACAMGRCQGEKHRWSLCQLKSRACVGLIDPDYVQSSLL